MNMIQVGMKPVTHCQSADVVLFSSIMPGQERYIGISIAQRDLQGDAIKAIRKLSYYNSISGLMEP